MPLAPRTRHQLAIDRRVDDLLKRMTTAEKIAQLRAVTTAQIESAVMQDAAAGEIDEEKLRAFCAQGFGRISALLHSRPPETSARIANRIQRAACGHTRLGIPVLIDSEALHGCKGPGCTVFPQAIGMAAMWNPELLHSIAVAIGRECRARGVHQVLSPVLDIARDARAGRTEETYGEDPYLVSRLGLAFVKGVQSQRVITTPKHFVANFVGDGGRDSYAMHASERLLREIYLPPYEAVIREGGALSVMSAYHSLDGTPCSAHRWLLNDLLRGEWGFRGTVVSDWGATHQICQYHHVAANLAEAARLALCAGLDVELSCSQCFNHLPDLVSSGGLSKRVLDAAVRRVLYGKFWTGAFDRPLVSPKRAVAVSHCAPHRQLALEAARQSITLLKNDGTLPLSRRVKRLAVLGPNAAVARLGGYSAPAPAAVSPLEGLRRLLGKDRALYAEGCGLQDTSKRGFGKARAAARKADAVVMFMGNSAPETEGENQDRCCLDLPGVQEDLILEVCKANRRVIVVLIGGSAVTMMRWADRVPAIVQAWYPGEEGGTAIAEVLFGLISPSGKLPLTFPKTTGQCPLYYNPKPSGRRYDYVDLRGEQARFPFGHGLSYTTFAYDRLKVRESGKGKRFQLTVSARIRNTGPRAGAEVVQLYLRDDLSRLSRPLMELKAFQRVVLKPGQAKTVRFMLNWRDLAYLGPDLRPTLEPGNFIVMMGSSSADIRLKTGTRENEYPAVAYQISDLQPPVRDIRRAALPLENVQFRRAEGHQSGPFHFADSRPLHKKQDGVLYIRTQLDLTSAGKGALIYGADGPVKAWVNGKAVDCRPHAAPPITPPDFRASVVWRKGRNDVLFALDTNEGRVWGLTARGIAMKRT